MDALLSGLGRLGPAAWACAGFAVLAVLGLVRPPSGRLEHGPGAWTWLAWPVLAGLTTVGLGQLEPVGVRRRRERLIADVPQALDLLAACVAAGVPVRLAGRVVVEAFDGPVAEDLGRVLALVELGVSESDAWRTLADHPQLGPAAA